MAVTKPNDPAAPVNAAAFLAQSGPDQFDTDLVALGFQATGVVSGCAVAQRGAGANMSVDVAAGTVEVAGTQVAVVGVNVAVGAAHATLARFDLVVVDSSGAVSVTAGSANANPCDPAIPASRAVLAEVYVPAAVTSIITSYLTDKRVIIGFVSSASVMPTAATLLFTGKVTGDSNNRVQIQADGAIYLGPGNTASDVLLSRSALATLSITCTPGNTSGGVRSVLNNAGTTAIAFVGAFSDTNIEGYVFTTSSTYATNGLLVANQTAFYSGNASSMLFATAAAADIIFATGGIASANERLRIKNSDGAVYVNGNLYAGAQSTASGVIAVRGSVTNSQSAYLIFQEDSVTKWQIYKTPGDGNLYLYNSVNSRAALAAVPGSAGNAALVVYDRLIIQRGAAGQTANLAEWQNELGTNLSYIASAGEAIVNALGVSRAPSASVTQAATTSSVIAEDIELPSGVIYELGVDAILEIT